MPGQEDHDEIIHLRGAQEVSGTPDVFARGVAVENAQHLYLAKAATFALEQVGDIAGVLVGELQRKTGILVIRDTDHDDKEIGFAGGGIALDRVRLFEGLRTFLVQHRHIDSVLSRGQFHLDFLFPGHRMGLVQIESVGAMNRNPIDIDI